MENFCLWAVFLCDEPNAVLKVQEAVQKEMTVSLMTFIQNMKADHYPVYYLCE